MPTPRHEAYTTAVINRLCSIVADRDHRAQVEEYSDSAETLLLLDLEPARAGLEAGLAANSRGAALQRARADDARESGASAHHRPRR